MKGGCTVKRLKMILFIGILSSFVAFATMGCEKEGDVEKAGKKVDEAIDSAKETGNKVGEAIDATKEAAE